jgi:hypothetical protein
MSYDPHSSDAMFSRVMTRLDKQDETLTQILAEVKKTNGRVTRLETENAVTKGKVAAVSALVSAVVGFAGWLLSHKG